MTMIGLSRFEKQKKVSPASLFGKVFLFLKGLLTNTFLFVGLGFDKVIVLGRTHIVTLFL